ncbi:MAG: FecR domain-containing protein [Bacteriovoracaceae bacterium]
MKRFFFLIIFAAAVTLSPAQVSFPSGQLNAKCIDLTGDAAAWPVILSFSVRDEASNSFTLSKDALVQIKKFSLLHGKVREGKLFFAKLLKAGARVFAPEELQRAISYSSEYGTQIQSGNFTELTRVGGLYLRSLELIRKEIEQKRNENIDALIAEKNGDVNKRKGFLGEWNAAQKGEMLAQADGIRTGDASFAQLAFTDGVEVMVDPNSTVVIRESKMDKLDQSVRRDIALVKGSLLTKLTESAKERNNFTFQAGTSESQVRSGKFWASAVEERRVKLSNYDGTMDVSANKGKVQLKMNEGTIVEKGKKPLPPVPLLPSPQLAWSGIDSVIYSDNFILRWSAIANSAGYKIELCKTKEFNTASKSFSPPQTTFRLENIDLGLVYVRLTAVDKFGLRGMESPVYKLMRVEDKLSPAIYVNGWDTDRRYTALSKLTVSGSTEADASFTVNGKIVSLDQNGVFTLGIAVEQSEKQLTLKSTDRSGNSRERLLSIVLIDSNRVITFDWNCPVEGTILIPATGEISARGTAYPSMRITVRHGEQESSVQTDSQGNWAISVQHKKGIQLTLVFESISDNIIVATKTYRVE